jgi:hypothetical protein
LKVLPKGSTQKSGSPTQNLPDRYSLYEMHNRQKGKPNGFHNPSAYSIITLSYDTSYATKKIFYGIGKDIFFTSDSR